MCDSSTRPRRHASQIWTPPNAAEASGPPRTTSASEASRRGRAQSVCPVSQRRVRVAARRRPGPSRRGELRRMTTVRRPRRHVRASVPRPMSTVTGVRLRARAGSAWPVSWTATSRNGSAQRSHSHAASNDTTRRSTCIGRVPFRTWFDTTWLFGCVPRRSFSPASWARSEYAMSRPCRIPQRGRRARVCQSRRTARPRPVRRD